MARRVTALILLVFALQLTACSPRLGKSFGVPSIPPAKVAQKVDSSLQSEIYIDRFGDARENPSLVQSGNEKVSAKQEIVPGVEAAVSRAFKNAGFAISDAAPVVVSGEVRTWVADVKKGLPSTVNSKAAIYIEVLDPANKKIYKGVYNGNAIMEHPSLGSEDISATLGTAMSEAISQIVADRQLMELLSSF